MSEMDQYQVVFVDKDGHEWSSFYEADDFAHAEEQAYDGAGTHPDEIVRIEKIR